jgi:hypothetical protein
METIMPLQPLADLANLSTFPPQKKKKREQVAWRTSCGKTLSNWALH